MAITPSESGGLLAVEQAGPELLAFLLREWETELRARGFPFDAATTPGIEADKIRRTYAAAGLVAPAEIVEWFSWRNGQPFFAPRLVPWCSFIDADGSTRRRAPRQLIGTGTGFWEPSWVRLTHSDPSLSLDTAEHRALPLVRITDFSVGTEPERDVSDILSLSTAVAWLLESLRLGHHEWDAATERWHVNHPTGGDPDLTRSSHI